MSWKPEVDGIERRRELARKQGGEEAVATQHARGRLTIRERIDGLLDRGSFQEQGPIAGVSETDDEGELTGFTPANYVVGLGRIDGRLCAVGGEDFTLRGGSPSPAGFRKSVMAEELACRYRVPLIRFLEGGGGSVAPARGPVSAPTVESPATPPRFLSIMNAMATVPVVSGAMGAVAGLPAARLVASHLAIMARDTAQVMIGGPALVERATGHVLSKDELGGPRVHEKSGVVDLVMPDERGVLEQVRRFLSYLPTNVWEPAPVAGCDDPKERHEEELLSLIPRDRRKPYKMRRIIELVVDRGSFFEMTRGYGGSQITGLARLSGQPVGILANDPYFYAGAMTAQAAQKVRRFVDLCDTFHLPILSLVDEPGFMIGPQAEADATIRHGTALLFAVMQSTVPWVSVVIRKTYGVAGAAHFGPGGHTLAWPSAESGALPLEGGVAVAFRREIAEAPDPDAKRRELEEELASRRSPYTRAEGYGVSDLIDPRRTRPELCNWVEWIQPQLALHLGPRSYTVRP